MRKRSVKLSVNGNPVCGGKDCFFDYRHEFFDDEDFLVLCDNFCKPLAVNRVCADLDKGDVFGKDFFHIGCRDTAGDDCFFAADFCAVISGVN